MSKSAGKILAVNCFVCGKCGETTRRNSRRYRKTGKWLCGSCARKKENWPKPRRIKVDEILKNKHIKLQQEKDRKMQLKKRKLEETEAKKLRIRTRCVKCGNVKPDDGLYSCDNCRKKRKREERFLDRFNRRIRYRNDAVKVEQFDPIDIFERDNWTCYLCGKILHPENRGTMSLFAPEIDHIVAVSNGGNHTPDNVACICRRCNIKKGDSANWAAELITSGG